MKQSDIRLFAHCKACMATKPANQSPSDWVRLDCGLTDTGLLVWCKRCRKEVAHFTPGALADFITNGRCACCPGGAHVK